MFDIQVSDEPIHLNSIDWESLSRDECGAGSSFFGMVRNRNHGRAVSAVAYDAYVPLAEKTLQDICQEALQQFGGKGSVFIRHRTGKLLVGELSVVIVVHTPHRDEAFKICRYVIEELKVRVPIWKKEFYMDGETEWLKGHALCSHTQVEG
jgi:molybdopterin synthase catalytic subunit